MIDYAEGLVQRYSHVGVMLDTNVLLLYVVGITDSRQIARIDRLQSRGFTERDFRTLDALIGNVKRVVTTPHILTEVSNFIGQIRRPLRDQRFTVLARFIGVADEQTYNARQAARMSEFVKFGLTDAVIFAVSQGNYLVITVDGPLYGYLSSHGVDTLNFNDLRN